MAEISMVKLSPIHAQKASELLAAQIRRQILSNTLPTGAKLPTERDLIAQTGLSRSSVREAMRILEAENLIATRPGRFGGTVANKPDDASLGRSLSLFVYGRRVRLPSLLQTREAIEPVLAELAAINRSDEELELLCKTTERVEEAFNELPQFLQANVDWHIGIAAASHNEVLRAVMISISNLIYKATATENFTTEAIREQVIQAHRRILEAIVAKDGAAARRRMGRHLAAVTAAMSPYADIPLELDV